ncbi:MAG: DUF3488 and transglutaminase-like domain-containing protein [Terrimesophilobacter sp.]
MAEAAARVARVRTERAGLWGSGPWGARHRRTEFLRVVMVFATFAVTLGGLHTILDGVGWWVLCVTLCATVLGTGAAVRATFSRWRLWGRLLAPAVSLLAAAILVMLRFGAGTGLIGIIPNSETWVRFGKLLRDAGYSITWQTVPARADEPISFVLALGVIVLVVAAEIVAFSLHFPALVGLPLAVVFLIPGLTPEGRTDGWFFAASALTYLALLLVGRRWHATPVLAVGALAVVSGLVLPGALPSTDFTVTSSGLGPSVSTGVNPMLHLGSDLRDNIKRTALTYSTVSGKPEYLRLAEISDFSGQDWGPGQPVLDNQNRPVAFPRAPGVSSRVTTAREVTYVHVANLASPWLPLPYAPSAVTGLQGSWQFLPESFTVASNHDLARGQNYTVASEQITPTPEQLLSTGTRVPLGLQPYLSLPTKRPRVIAETAQSVTASEPTNYEKALALQEYLRSEPFHYSESAPEAQGYDGTGVAYVAAFLKQHEGYCIHFASAMAVMARELGIPSRIIVGFQPGTLQSEQDQGRRLFSVTTKDLHSWPELYFDGIGWVRFEPTPSRGEVPAYANQSVTGVPSMVAPDAGTASPSGRDPNAGAPSIDDGPTAAAWLSTATRGGWLVIGGGLLGLGALIFVPAVLRVVRRSRRLAAVSLGHGTVVSLWREIVDTAQDAGISIGPTLTPREARARLHRARGMSDAGRAALDRVGEALEREGYGPPRVDGANAQALNAIVADARVVISCLLASTPNDARLKAFLLPASLVASTQQAVRRWV